MSRRVCRFLLVVLLIVLIPLVMRADEPISYDYSNMLVVINALDYLGTPYIYGGIEKNGLDCSGLLYVAFRNIWEDTPRVSKDWLMLGVAVNGEYFPGDVLLFAENGIIFHVAIYVGDRYFVHAASAGQKTGVIISSLDEAYWSKYFYGARRMFL